MEFDEVEGIRQREAFSCLESTRVDESEGGSLQTVCALEGEGVAT